MIKYNVVICCYEILRLIFRIWDVGVWTGLSWLKDRWQALVNAVMRIRVAKNRLIS